MQSSHLDLLFKSCLFTELKHNATEKHSELLWPVQLSAQTAALSRGLALKVGMGFSVLLT